MILYLQKNSIGKKYWIYKRGNEYGITTAQKEANDFALNELEKVKRDITRALSNYPKYVGFSIHSHMDKVSRKASVKNTIGQLVSIVYKSADDGQLYQHTFKTKPSLIASSEKKLEIIGGKYSITDRGIVG